MPSSNIEYHAEFDGLKELSLSCNDLSKGVVKGAGTKIIGDNIQISCDVINGIFKGWYNDNNELVSSFNSYEFTMPSDNYHLTAVFYSNEEEEQYNYDIEHGIIPHFNTDFTKVTYGMYPQCVVDDQDLVNNLNMLETTDEHGYYCYNNNYYVKKVVSIYNFERYYGITNYPKNFDNGEEMLSESIRWFKVEPIEWDVLNHNDNQFTLISSRVLEKQQFDKDGGTIVDKKVVYENNYEYSSIRKWLNEQFVNKAFFLNGENCLVIDSNVDNSPKTTGSEGNIYACGDTIDKVYMPSVLDTDFIRKLRRLNNRLFKGQRSFL